MYKQGKEYIVTIRYNSNNNHPKDWDLENMVWLEHGEVVEVIGIAETPVWVGK
jgi:hypothetical protein